MTAFDARKIGKLVKEARGPFPAYADAPAICPSPNWRYAVVFSHGEEVSMMDMRFCMTLLASDLSVLDLFEPVRATAPICVWNARSTRFVVAAFAEGDCYVVCDIPGRRFALVRVSSRQALCAFEGRTGLRIRFDPEQLEALNCDGTFGAGQAEYPIPRFAAPAEALVDLSTLQWHPLDELGNLADVAEKLPVLEMDAVEDGYFPFDGSFPKSTTDRLNGRQMEVFHLEAFAGYGDRQAQAWLREVRKTAGKRYNRWARVARYLGKRSRTIPPPNESRP